MHSQSIQDMVQIATKVGNTRDVKKILSNVICYVNTSGVMLSNYLTAKSCKAVNNSTLV